MWVPGGDGGMGDEGSKSLVWMHWWEGIARSASWSRILANHGCRRRGAVWVEYEWDCMVVYKRKHLGFCRLQEKEQQSWDFISVELRTCLDGGHCCLVFPMLTYWEATGSAQLPCSAARLSAECISAGEFLLSEVFPSTWWPSQCPALCTFPLMCIAGGGMWGCPAHLPCLGAHASPGSKRVSEKGWAMPNQID